jgi:hypothetical protein
MAATAKQALDTTAHEVSQCRHGKVWGIASATVTFGNDGSVTHVTVGVPFTGTATGQCVADALGSVHVGPFGGKPGVLSYRFYVSPR